jgi:hypothetical protein
VDEGESSVMPGQEWEWPGRRRRRMTDGTPDSGVPL